MLIALLVVWVATVVTRFVEANWTWLLALAVVVSGALILARRRARQARVAAGADAFRVEQDRLHDQQERLRRSNIQAIDRMTGREFEQILVALFTARGFDVTWTKESNDYGADLVAQYQGRTWVIQAKRYGEGRTVGVQAVQEVVAAQQLYRADRAVLVTNRSFTKQAVHLGSAPGKLVDSSG